jgi:hypothetical protein
MTQNPSEKWLASSIPGVVTPEQTVLVQAGLEWLAATAVLPPSDNAQLPAPPARREYDDSKVV